MSEGDMAVIKPEMMKSYIWLQTTDGSIQLVEQEVAMYCPMICKENIQKGMGASKNHAISLPERVSTAMLSLILDYCRFHQVPGRSNKEEKLEPLKNSTDDPRIRLLNRLYARKRRELQEREKLKNAELEEEQNDERSVDDLLSFINGEIGDSKGIKTSKNKKNNRRRKDQQKSTCLYEANEIHEVSRNLNFACPSDELNKFMPISSLTLKLQDLKDDRVEDMIGFDDGDIDDEIDPALKEKTDREVEDFARRLNSDWPERMQEILSLGQERRPVPFSINGNGSFRRYA